MVHALRAAKRGGEVVPVDLRKKPLTKWTAKGGSTRDPEQIREWFERKDWKCAGFALKCGSVSGEVVLDVDAHRDGDVKSLGFKLPPTLTVRTPRGGTHYHFKADGVVPTNGKLDTGIELKGDGSLCMLPGSQGVLDNGSVVSYTVRGRKLAPAALPQPLLRATANASDGSNGLGGGIPQGEQNIGLTKLAGSMRYAGADEAEILAGLKVFRDTRCDNPEQYADSRLEATARSIGKRDRAVEQELVKIRSRNEALSIIAGDNLRKGYAVPTTNLTQELAEEREPLKYTVEELHVEGGNTLLVASYKTGKTTVLDNLIKSVVDDEPFLGRYETHFDRNVGILNFELTKEMCIRWLEDLGIEHTDRICPWHLRGCNLPFWMDTVKQDLVGWLQRNDVGLWVIDTTSRAWTGFVDSEGNNIKIVEFFDLIDEIKQLAGVDNCVATMHTPRIFMKDGEERARAAVGSEAWMDHGWYLTKEKNGTRSLRADGRDVHIEAFDLAYDMDTRRYSHSGVAKVDRRARDDMYQVVDALAALKAEGVYPALTGKVTDKMKSVAGGRRSKVLDKAVEDGYVHRADGKGRTKLHTLTDEGEVLHLREIQRN